MKILKPRGNALEKTNNKKVFVDSRLKAFYDIRQRKALYKQIIRKSSCGPSFLSISSLVLEL